MTKLAILNSKEQAQFDAPPKFHRDDRPLYFALTSDIRRLGFSRLRTNVNRVGFVLQLGYFRASGRFFTPEQFYKRDINFVASTLGIADAVDIADYRESSRKDHRDTILSISGWSLPTVKEDEEIVIQAQWYIKQQLSPRKVLETLVEFCWNKKVVIPSYSKLSEIITDNYNDFEGQLLATLNRLLTSENKAWLDSLFISAGSKPYERPSITGLRHIDQSVSPLDIKSSVEAFETIKKFHVSFTSVMGSLDLSDQATEYYATWVQKAVTFQLTSFADPVKAYLYILAYIKHQYFLRQDTLIDILLKTTSSARSRLGSQLQKMEQEQRSSRNKAIKTVSKSNKDLTRFSNQVVNIVMTAPVTESEKIRQLEQLIEEHLKSYDDKEQQRIKEMEKLLEDLSGQATYYEQIEKLSIRLQRRVSGIIKAIDFSERSADKSLLLAIAHFKNTGGDIGHQPPFDFLTDDEQNAVENEGNFRLSLYKALLFFHISSAIKSGSLIFDSTYRYKGVFDYLIDEETWDEQREDLLATAGLTSFGDVNAVLVKLKSQLNKKYREVNQRELQGDNELISFDKNGKAKVSTPKIDNDDFSFVGDTLMQAGYVPIQTILSDVNTVCDFGSCFKHFMNKHKKMKPSQEVLLAGIIGKGCNIGLNRIANISVGISKDVLNNTVNWFFDLKNVQQASDKIVGYIDKLSLANAYRYDPNVTHTSSDGQKYYVAVDSLNSAYSFKYFGSDKGSTVYTFIDEQQSLFYSTVISASEREAAFVIDGLMHNEVVKSQIHSSDTHGYTEAIFGTTHFIGTSFAPRIKNIGSQTIYGFENIKTYKDKGFKILPSRVINSKLIKENWEDILRFMVTIKLKKTSASQLFSRLNSYTSHIPLYKALKEFGRILKSHFILTYFDDVILRQRVEKQLNRVELSNKFAKAIFFANSQELHEATKPEQDLVAACKMLIQNAIVLWNYLYLSEFLANMKAEEERNRAVGLILNGSVLTWRHVNLHGEYDFTRDAANDTNFDLARILALNVNR